MLWIYAENDTFFGLLYPSDMHDAYTNAGGKAEYHMLPPLRRTDNFDRLSRFHPMWAPLVSRFLEKN